MTLLKDIDPSYYKYFIYLDTLGRKFMCAESKKSVYATLEASLIFWTKISKSLEKLCYQINKYHRFVMKKNFKGKDCIILYNDSELNMSHVDYDILYSIISNIDE